MRGKGWSGMLSVLGFSLFILGWWIVAAFSHPLFVPSPWITVTTAVELAGTGFLHESILMSMGRIMGGWLLGCALGIPLGLLMGWLPGVRTFATPYIQGLRYIPPISFVGIFIVWFGLGEASKIMLVFYTSFFVIVINTMAGTLSAPPGVLRAARSLGATESQVLLQVVVPETVPYIVTGMRMAMGNAFIVIAAAEMLAARSGMGYLIWSARNFMLTDQIFVGFLGLGLLGLTTDRVFRVLAYRFLSHYRVV